MSSRKKDSPRRMEIGSRSTGLVPWCDTKRPIYLDPKPERRSLLPVRACLKVRDLRKAATTMANPTRSKDEVRSEYRGGDDSGSKPLGHAAAEAWRILIRTK